MSARIPTKKRAQTRTQIPNHGRDAAGTKQAALAKVVPARARSSHCGTSVHRSARANA